MRNCTNIARVPAREVEHAPLRTRRSRFEAQLHRLGHPRLHGNGLGLVSLRYALPTIPFPVPLPNFTVRHNWLVAHAVFASLALLTGPWQFLPVIRRRWLTVHRRLGRLYCSAVLFGWIASLPIAAHAQSGAISSAGFLTLGAFWIATTAAGYFAIRAGKAEQHRRWMVRSYALTGAAITLRNYLPLLVISGLSFDVSYRIVAWLCWIPNLIFAEWLLRRRAGIPHNQEEPLSEFSTARQ